jgi:hypothetical protein
MNERRRSNRIPMSEPCVVAMEGREIPTMLENLSDEGALLRIDGAAGGAVSSDDLGYEGTFLVSSFTPARRYSGEVIRLFFRDGNAFIAMRFWRPFQEVS